MRAVYTALIGGYEELTARAQGSGRHPSMTEAAALQATGGSLRRDLGLSARFPAGRRGRHRTW